MELKTLVFDIYSDYGCFRKPWAVTSPLTYPFPPYPTVAGMLGVIVGLGKRKLFLGIDKEEYLQVFSKQNFSISVGIAKVINPRDLLSVGLNLLNTKPKPEGIGFNEDLMLYVIKPKMFLNVNLHTQIKFDFIKSPRYRIYVTCINKDCLSYFDKLCKYVQEHKSVYTLYMGMNGLLANVEYIGLYNCEFKQNHTGELITVSSIVPKNKFSKVRLQENGKYMREEKVPVDMTADRVTEYDDIVYEVTGKPIVCDVKEYYFIEKLNINVVSY